MYTNTANSHTEYGHLNTTYCYTECSSSTLSYSLSILHNTHQIQKQQQHYIHINNNPSTPPRVTSTLSPPFTCLKMTTEDQLHCVSLTAPFRGTTTVREVATPNPLVSKTKKKVSLSTFLCRSLEVRGFFYNTQEITGFHR